MLASGHDDLGEIVIKQITEVLNKELLLFKKDSQNDELHQFFKNQITFEFNIESIPAQTLFQIFTHKSFSHESGGRFEHNEKLEFLGDAVLELLVTQKIMNMYPELNEGQLSKLRSSLVNEDSLSELARSLKLSEFIILGKGELKGKGHEKSSILADVFEALLGGFYKVNGFELTQMFFDELIELFNKRNNKDFWHLSSVQNFDAKTKLQEIVMQKFKTTPHYECKEIQDKGEFHINCSIEDKVIADGVFSSKKKGMQQLAAKILQENLLDHMESLC